jgi:hypothetical protein
VATADLGATGRSLASRMSARHRRLAKRSVHWLKGVTLVVAGAGAVTGLAVLLNGLRGPGSPAPGSCRRPGGPADRDSGSPAAGSLRPTTSGLLRTGMTVVKCGTGSKACAHNPT